MHENEIRTAIKYMASARSTERQSAAELLYRAGVSLSRPVVLSWCAHEELAALLLRDPLAPMPDFLGITVGVAVAPSNFHLIRDAWNSPRLAEVPPDQDALEFELHAGGGVALDILTSRDPAGSGAIARFLARIGEGIQQVEYLVRDVARACSLVRDLAGLSPVYPAPRPGAGSTTINFFLAVTPGGGKVLIELVELAGSPPGS
jgi:hypothetical protein